MFQVAYCLFYMDWQNDNFYFLLHQILFHLKTIWNRIATTASKRKIQTIYLPIKEKEKEKISGC